MDGESVQDPLFGSIPERPPIYRINGVELALGAMTVAELTVVQIACKERLEAARLDMLIINHYIHGAHMNAYRSLRPME